jgi:nitrite reductase/ring-hydroxylating ferredoxin subunit
MSGWVAAALSADLALGEVFGTRAGGVELALWRDEAGAVHAFEDRCPHRGMRLSLGFVRGDVLACLYHGWRFSGDGACRHIPAHPELKPPSTIRAAGFPAAERGGLVWVAGAQLAEAPPDPGCEVPMRSLFLRVPLARAVAALPRALRVEGEAPGGLRVQIGEAAGFVATQPLGEAACALHVLTSVTEGRAALARALAIWRDELEATA